MANYEMVKSSQGQVGALMKQSEASLMKSLPKGTNIHALARDIKYAIAQSVNQKSGTTLAQCDAGSIIASAISATTMGLSVNPNRKQAYMIPYNGAGPLPIAQLNVSYIGLRDMIYNETGIRMKAVLVYMNESLEYHEDGFETVWKHTIIKDETQRGALRMVASLAKEPDGTFTVETMSPKEIEDCRLSSKAPNGPAWNPKGKWYGEMAKKSVSRRHTKSLPSMTSKVASILQADEDLSIGRPQFMDEAYEQAGITPVEQPITEVDEDTAGTAFDSFFDAKATEIPNEGENN